MTDQDSSGDDNSARLEELHWRLHFTLSERNIVQIKKWILSEKELPDEVSNQAVAQIFSESIAQNARQKKKYLSKFSPAEVSNSTPQELIATVIEEQLEDPKQKKRLIAKLTSRLNQEIVRVAMAVLCSNSLEKREIADGRPERPDNITSLSHAMSVPGSQATYKALQEWVLHTLQGVGWIDGYWDERAYKAKDRYFFVTKKGLDLYREYLTVCDRGTDPYDQNIKDIRTELEELGGRNI